MFTELKNRGAEDALIAVCDGLKGLPEATNTTWEHTVVQLWRSSWARFVPFLEYDARIRRVI